MINNHENRPLGAFEKAFWLLDYTNPASFAMAMEIEGTAVIAQWESALSKVQKRHPNMSVAIPWGINKRLEFHHFPETTIPLRVVTAAADYRWEAEIENELALPFDTTKAPLLRAIIVQKPGEFVFMMNAHHAIADGKSLTFIFRDLLLVLGGAELENLPFLGSTDDMLNLPQADESGFKTALPIIPNKNNKKEKIASRILPQLNRFQFSTALTQQIAERSRREKTTFHGALCAAAIITSRALYPDWKEKILQLVTPVDERKTLGVLEDFALTITTKNVFFDPKLEMTFWELARFAKQELSATDPKEYVRGYIDFFRQFAFTDLDFQAMLDVMNTVFVQDLMITNLGIISFNDDRLAYKPKAIWGPIVISGSDTVQTMGALTYNGKLCLTNFSRLPIASLLSHMAQKMEEACTAP